MLLHLSLPLSLSFSLSLSLSPSLSASPSLNARVHYSLTVGDARDARRTQAPETAAGEWHNHSVDLWALGILLFEFLAGLWQRQPSPRRGCGARALAGRAAPSHLAPAAAVLAGSTPFERGAEDEEPRSTAELMEHIASFCDPASILFPPADVVPAEGRALISALLQRRKGKRLPAADALAHSFVRMHAPSEAGGC